MSASTLIGSALCAAVILAFIAWVAAVTRL